MKSVVLQVKATVSITYQVTHELDLLPGHPFPSLGEIEDEVKEYIEAGDIELDEIEAYTVDELEIVASRVAGQGAFAS